MNWKVLPVESGQIADTETGTVMLPAAALVLEVARLASAAERIAAALEAGRDDPDAYEYRWVTRSSEADTLRADGYKIAFVTDECIVMRRPRTQE